MRPSSEAPAPAGVAPWLRALWGQPAQVALLAATTGQPGAARRPVLTGHMEGERVLHLPPAPLQPLPGWTAAASAHAAAHWRFGGPPQARTGLKPVQLALFGVLEDARVEGLALQELPGLRQLWLPYHLDDAPEGGHFAALLARLSRVLLDPDAVDPHPWVVRVRAIAGERLAGILLPDLRALASALGNEVGQMRLPFNPASYCVHAAYRDDNHHLWDEDTTLPPSEQPLAGGATSPPPDGAALPTAPVREARVVLHPEWDYRIARDRQDWVRVHESDAPAAAGPVPVAAPAARHLVRQLAGALAACPAGGPRRPAGRAAWGDEFHATALVEAGVRRRLREPADERVYRRPVAPARHAAVLLLVDLSASTGGAPHSGTPALLPALLELAQGAGAALEAVGHRCATAAFRSDGRHRVDLLHLKHWDEAADAATVRRRYLALAPGGSTRTGAAVRQAVAALGGAGPAAAVRRVVLLTDGEPHDIDVPDPRYLARDFARAVQQARRVGVDVRTVPPATIARRRTNAAALARLLVG
jgi:nitric oxide reductase NorD protein